MFGVKRNMKKKEAKLENRIGILTCSVLVIIFSVLICVTAILTQSAMTVTIDSQFKAMAKATGVQVQTIVDDVMYAAQNVEGKLEDGMQTSSNTEGGRASMIYQNVILPENLSDIEKYAVDMIRNTVRVNDNIDGGGIFFEPYAFSRPPKILCKRE